MLCNTSSDSTSLPIENGNGNINVVDNMTSTPNLPTAESSTSAKTTVIIGVVVKSFSGTTTQDLMKSYIQLTINNAPDRLCLHIGTNDLKSKVPNDIANALVDFAE